MQLWIILIILIIKFHTFLIFSYQKTIGDYQLDSSETATLGGAYGVRAYPNGFGEADSMILTTIGLRFSIFSPNFYITPFLWICPWMEWRLFR